MVTPFGEIRRGKTFAFCDTKAVMMMFFLVCFSDLNITVDVISGNTKALPMATTCGQRMSIPLYPSKKILKRKLLQAIQCQGYGLG